MKNTVFLVRNKNIYFYPLEEKCVEAFKKNNISIIFNKVCKKLNIKIPIFMIEKKVMDADKIVFTDSGFNYPLYKRLKEDTNKELILYYMNTIDQTNENLIKLFDKIYTFDLQDSKKYDIEFKHTPYSDKIKSIGNIPQYDTLFLGRSKNRIDEIISIKKLLDNKKLNNNFLVLDTDIEEVKLKHFLSYAQYIDLVNKSRCLVEINQSNQYGCSLRFMESLFLHKKLITNNKNIIHDPFFDQNNMYVLECDNRDLYQFIYSPYIKNSQDLRGLVFENWIKEF